ncbi:UDP-N-acetylglucosamine transferase subunit [Conoideocrella luteorostrata]|uniref:UDP-N-acetylglucosamine transferase subunit ALG14 n=1 Tax=Conoideocrella luteorostrata TaxID=1105319 RepID=A0AAJ0CGF3_9HYPO|nr:UDP-N-acetylglucosamine transferase subunit [Conoideocrella luteorostrata]
MITTAAALTAILVITAFIGSFVAVVAHFVRSWTSIILTLFAGFISASIYITTRHIQVSHARRAASWPRPPFKPKNSTQSEHEYYLFVLGSGGHTKEMLMMMDDGCPDHLCNSHRRYLISGGDRMSENHLEDYEAELKATSANLGTYDKHTVTRARRVHQPLWSTPWTSLLSIIDILPVLLSPPRNEVGRALRFPSIIYSNGPATGFFVALAVHFLKVLGVVPDDKMKFVYIESWARITTLSWTGKLLYYTGIADAFYVQHGNVAARYEVPNAGEMVLNSRRAEPIT